jgi:site-specific DNA-methyltransferase (adenine-specific)
MSEPVTEQFVIQIGDCRDRLKELPDNSIDSIVTDPPYELGFMGKAWDSTGIAYDEDVWRECLRVLKHGGHLLAFGGSRTYHRMACAIEDAGFQIRDQIMWVYGSGFPKSHDIGKRIDKESGETRNRVPSNAGIASGTNNFVGSGKTRPNTKIGDDAITPEAKQWEGWGTALKPAHEPIVMARKPFNGTVANNVLTHGTGGLNIDGCRVTSPDNDGKVWTRGGEGVKAGSGSKFAQDAPQLNGVTELVEPNPLGRFPANFIHDGSDEVLALFPSEKAGSAARFFYCAKTSKRDRNEGLDGFEKVKGGSIEGVESRPNKPTNHPMNQNYHPTVKPTDLMRYLCRLVTPPNGTVLDPFTGSGSTGKGAVLEGFNFVGIELSADYAAIAVARITACIAAGQSQLRSE